MKKLLIILVACATVSLGYAQDGLKVGAKKQCTAAQKASCTKSSLAKTASLEAEGYEVSKCAKSGSLTASKTCSASGKVTTVKTCGASGKTVKTIADKEGNLLTKEVISGEAVSKNAATTDEKAKEVAEDGAFNFNADDLMLEGYTVKSCASSGSTTAKKSCSASGKVTKIKQSAEGVVTKTVVDAEGVVLSTEVLQDVKEAAAEAKFDFANLEADGFEMKTCATSGSKTASKTCGTSGKTTNYKKCGTSGKVTKTVKDKEGNVVSTEELGEASNTTESMFDFANLKGDGFEMKSCATSGNKYASKACSASGKTTGYKMCGASGTVTKTVTDKEGEVLSSEIVSNGKADVVEALEISATKKACCASKSAKSCSGKSAKSSGNKTTEGK